MHSSAVSTFHRRAYHLLNPDSGTALYPVTNASKAGKNNLPPSLILVHYLDTKIASSHCAALIDRGVDINPTLHPNLGHPQNGMTAPQPQAQMFYNDDGMPNNFQQNQNQQPQHHPAQMVISNEGNHVPQQHPEMCMSNEEDQDDLDYPLNYELDGDDVDDTAIDFLWDVVVEEGNNDVKMHSSNLSDMLTPELIEKMFDSELVGSLFEHGELFRMGQSEMEVDVALTNKTEVLTKEKLESFSNGQNDLKPAALLVFGQSASIANILDVTPEILSLDAGPVKLVVSLSDSAPSTIDDAEEQFVWKRLVCFLECPTPGSRPVVTKTVEAIILNPYCYQCTVPERSLESGSYKVMIVAVKLSAGVHHSQSKITDVVCRAMRTIFQSGPSFLPANYHSVSFEGIELRIMTQLSTSRIKTMTTTISDNASSSQSANSSSMIRGDLPAPPPAMALVATMLSDFPNPPPGAVLPPDSVITTHTDSEVENGSTFEEANENFLNNVEVNKIFSHAMEATVRGAKKRRGSVIEIPRTTYASTADLGDSLTLQGHWAAGHWAAQTSTDLECDTKADAVDRHCKIRFVERLTSVISEAGGDELVKETLPRSITTIKQGDGNALSK